MQCDELPEAALLAAIQRYPKLREADFCDNKKARGQGGAVAAPVKLTQKSTAEPMSVAAATPAPPADSGADSAAADEQRAFTDAVLAGGDAFWGDLERWLREDQGCSASEARSATNELQRRHAQTLGGFNLDGIEALAKRLLGKEPEQVAS